MHVITGTGTQGRFGNGQGQEYAEAYVLEYWRPKLGKWVRYRFADGQEVSLCLFLQHGLYFIHTTVTPVSQLTLDIEAKCSPGDESKLSSNLQ